jgi:hypothetical protein
MLPFPGHREAWASREKDSGIRQARRKASGVWFGTLLLGGGRAILVG